MTQSALLDTDLRGLATSDHATIVPPPRRVSRPADQQAGARPAHVPPLVRARGPRRRWSWLVVAVLVFAGVAVLVWRGLPVSAIATDVARRDVTRTLVLTGRVRPPSRSRLGANIAGTVREVLVREGDHVNRGQLLVRLDGAQAEAGVAQANAVLAQVEAQARSTVVQAERAFEQASRDLSRARVLLAQGAISARDLEVAERTATDTRAELDAARARVSGSSTPLAEVARARGAVAAARSQLALTRLTSPAPATVLGRDVEPGDAVTPGQMLLELALDGPTELVAFAREENLGELRAAMAAVASADAYPSQSFAARIAWLAPAVDPAQGTVEVRFAVPTPPTYLRADMTVSINVEVERKSGALVIPRELLHDAASATPWVTIERGGRAVRRDVRLGIVGEREAEVLSGLAEGDRVLPVGVAPDARVRLTR